MRMKTLLALIVLAVAFVATAIPITDSELLGWLHFASALVFLFTLPYAAMNGLGLDGHRPKNRRYHLPACEAPQ